MTARAPRNLEAERGQTMAEYSLVLAIITLASIGAYAVLSGSIIDAIERAADVFG